MKDEPHPASLACFLLRQIAVMRKLLALTIFLGWLAAIIFTGLELEKIQFFKSLIARLIS
jgi:hypothetical protein